MRENIEFRKNFKKNIDKTVAGATLPLAETFSREKFGESPKIH